MKSATYVSMKAAMMINGKAINIYDLMTLMKLVLLHSFLFTFPEEIGKPTCDGFVKHIQCTC